MVMNFKSCFSDILGAGESMPKVIIHMLNRIYVSRDMSLLNTSINETCRL